MLKNSVIVSIVWLSNYFYFTFYLTKSMELRLPTILKFCYTIIVVFILARFLYYPGKGQKEYLFTYILLAAIIAELCILISRVEMSFGFALGIFAIFQLDTISDSTDFSPRNDIHFSECWDCCKKPFGTIGYGIL